MAFFKNVDYSEVINLLYRTSDKVSFDRFFDLDGWTSFLIKGKIESFDPKELLNRMVEMVPLSTDVLDDNTSTPANAISFLPEAVTTNKIEKGNFVMSLFCSFYPEKAEGLDELLAAPFHADATLTGSLRDVIVGGWVPWGGFSWKTVYEPAHDKDPDHYEIERRERFRIEDTYDYIKKNGEISLKRDNKGDVVLNAEESILDEARHSGGRDGHFENYSWYKKTHEDIPNCPEYLRIEKHLVIPAIRIVYNLDQTYAGKNKTAAMQAFQYDSEHIIFIMWALPKLNNPANKKAINEQGSGMDSVDAQTSKRSKGSNGKKKSFWDKLFK